MPNLRGSRGMRHVSRHFGVRERVRIVRQYLAAERERKHTGRWTFPVAAGGSRERDFLRRRVDASRGRAIFQHARDHRTSVSHVLVGALYLAVCHVRPQRSDRPLPINYAVDRRRHLPSKEASALCNLAGAAVITIDSRSGKSLDGVVKQIRDQVHAQRGEHFGLLVGSFVLESLPVIRHLPGLIVYSYAKRAVRRATQRNSGPHDGQVPGGVLFTDMGELEHDRLAFAGTDITDAFVTLGKLPESMGMAAAGFLAMAVSGFQGSLTLSLGYGARAFVNGVFEEMMRVLPA